VVKLSIVTLLSRCANNLRKDRRAERSAARQTLPPPQPEIPSSSTKTSSTAPYDGPEVELAEYLANVEVIRELSDGLGVKCAIVCPWVEEHGGGDRTGTRIGQRAGGGLWSHCDYEHCQGRGRAEFCRRAPRRRFRVIPPRGTEPKGRVVISLG